MRRSPQLVVTILCPHFERPVRASQNSTTEKLVDCESKDDCATVKTDERGVTITLRPQACPVFRGQ